MEKNDLYKFPDVSDIETIQLFENWIGFVVNYYCQKNSIEPYESKDLRQFISIRLIEQLPKIKSRYKGESKLKTYISAIVLNLCREFRKKNCSKSILTNIEINKVFNFKQTGTNSGENNIAIEYEVKKLNYIILMYGSKSAKVILALKMYYGHQVTKQEVLNYCKDSSLLPTEVLEGIRDNDQLTKKEALAILTQFFNRVENKSNLVEATRKWVSRLIEDILSVLNKSTSSHTKETLGLLLEVKQFR